MRIIWYGLLILLVICGVVLAVSNTWFSSDEGIDVVEGQKIPVMSAKWDGKEIQFTYSKGPSFSQMINPSSPIMMINYSERVKIRQTVVWNHKKYRVKWDGLIRGFGWTPPVNDENIDKSYTLFITPRWQVMKKKILFWEIIYFRKEHITFSFE